MQILPATDKSLPIGRQTDPMFSLSARRPILVIGPIATSEKWRREAATKDE
jgi:hypothetical protein